MKGEVYIKISNGVDDWGDVISFTEVNDLISECSKIPLSTKGNIDTDYVKQVISPEGDVINVGEFLKISFDTIDMNEETLSFLTSLLNSKVDVIFYDPIEKGILYGVQYFIPSLKVINIDDYQAIHIAGQTTDMDSLIWYKIFPKGVKINYPRNGFIYNNLINNINGFVS